MEGDQGQIDCLIERSARFQRANPVFAKLSIGGMTPPELKRMDRDADRARATYLLTALEEHFVLPRIADREHVAYLAVAIVDLAFMLSMSEAGTITPAWLQYANVAAAALLSHHFGNSLQPRPSHPAAMQERLQEQAADRPAAAATSASPD